MLNVDFQSKYGLKEAEQSFNLILLSGVYDLRPLISTDINDALRLNAHSASLYSPLLFENMKIPDAAKENIQVLIAYGEHDSPAFKEQSDLFSNV